MLNQTYTERFWSKVNKSSGVFAVVKGKSSECWMWTAGCSYGYGRFWAGKGKICYPAHVVAYMFKHNLLKRPKLHVLHHCDHPSCVRPSHLWEGTPQDNMTDKKQKGRAVSTRVLGENNGRHVLTSVQVGRIRKEFYRGYVTRTFLAKKYKVVLSTVSRVVSLKTWALK